jgi:hypothetical protein
VGLHLNNEKDIEFNVKRYDKFVTMDFGYDMNIFLTDEQLGEIRDRIDKFLQESTKEAVNS